jgi:hypothetical protein
MEEDKELYIMDKSYKIIVTLFLLHITFFSCKIQQLMEDKFKWLPTYSAPKIAPVEIYEGYIYNKDEPIIKIKNWGIINPGWGNSSGTAVIGSEEKLIPDSLDITWLSLSENIFYNVKNVLPKEKMLTLFKEGFISIYDKKEHTYNEVIIGFAPKGFISVWLSGEKEQIEIANFKGSAISIPLEKVKPADLYMFTDDYAKKNIADLPKEIQAQIKVINIDSNQWEQFHKKYTWHTQFNIPKNTSIADVIISYINGEKEAHLQNELKEVKPQPRALPKAYLIRWENKELNSFGADIILNEKEIHEAFNSILNVSGENIVMVITILEDKVFLNLQNDNFKYPLVKSKIDIYPISR